MSLQAALVGAAGRAARWMGGWSIGLALAAPAAAQAPDDLPPVLATDDLVRLALEDAPALDALFDNWTAALEAAEAARSMRPQPRIGYTAYILAVETRQGPQRHMVSLSQAFPWARALRDADDPYLAQAREAAARFDAAALQRVYEVRASTLRLARAAALRRLVLEQRQVYEDVLEQRLAVMRVGLGDQGDALRLTLMVELLADQAADLAAAADAEHAELYRLVPRARSPETEIALPDLDVEQGSLPSVDALVERMGRRHPAFEAYAARTEAEIERAEVAANGVLPMPAVSVGWGVVGTYDDPLPGTGDGGRDVFNVGLSIPLPVFRRQYAYAEAAGRARAEAASAESADAHRRFAADIEAAVVRTEEETDRLVRYERDLVPAAREVTEHFAIELAQDDAQLTEYLLAFEQELELRRAIIESRFVVALERARLDMLTAGYVSELAGDSPPSAELGIETYGGAP